MDASLRERIEQQLKTMTEADWQKIREEVSRDPELVEAQRKMEASQLTGCPIHSGYCLRLPL